MKKRGIQTEEYLQKTYILGNFIRIPQPPFEIYYSTFALSSCIYIYYKSCVNTYIMSKYTKGKKEKKIGMKIYLVSSGCNFSLKFVKNMKI